MEDLTLENFEQFIGDNCYMHWNSMWHLLTRANANDESTLAWRAMLELADD